MLELLMRILQWPSIEGSDQNILINAKRNNEREFYNARVRLLGLYRGESNMVSLMNY